MVGSCAFKEGWLSNDRFKSSLKEHPKDKHKAICKLCNNKRFSIEKMGVSALVSHMNGKKYSSIVKSTKPLQSLFFKPKAKPEPNSQSLAEHQSDIDNEVEKATTSAQPTTSNQPSTSNQPTTSTQVATSTPTDVAVGALDAEIRWALKVVMNQLFEAMFSDSDIAKKFQMSKTKVSYVVIFGLVDYFYNSLITLVKKSPFYSLLFDKSLNKVLSKEQMDLQIRFYDDTVEVLTRYLDSRFVNRPNAVNLCNETIDAIKNLDQAKMLMLRMDGPNFNLLIFVKLNGEREKHYHSPLYNIGSCGLHSIHGAFETGMISCGWEINKIMKSMHKLFDKSSARRDLFILINSLNTSRSSLLCPFLSSMDKL